MLIGEVASRSGVPAKTIRYYESVGLLPTADRHANGYRVYSEPILDRLAFIRAAQSSGFTLGEIREIIAFRDQGQAPCGHVRDLIDQHAADVEERIAELQRTRRELGRLAGRARQLDPTDCQQSAVCHILAPRVFSASSPPPTRRGPHSPARVPSQVGRGRSPGHVSGA